MKRLIRATRDIELEVIHDADDDDGNPTNWAVEMIDYNGKKHWIWISLYDDDEEYYQVEDSRGNNLTQGKTYKTLSGAKRAAKDVVFKQEARDWFTD